MKNMNIKKGYDLKIVGAPAPDVLTADTPKTVAALPERIPFIKPRLKVAVGDTVEIGSVLFEDKRNPDLRFLSPGAGEVEAINFGPRRVIKEIVIRLSDRETEQEFDSLSGDALDGADRNTLIRRIVEGGLWCLIRQLPFRQAADPRTPPPMIIVGLDSKEPFHPRPDIYLKGNEELFGFGLKLLDNLSQGRLVLFGSREGCTSLNGLEPRVTHTVTGAYPATDPGTLLYKIKQKPEEARAWYVNGQDVLLLARLIKEGRYPTERIVAVGGSRVDKPAHVKTRIGAPLKLLCPDVSDNGGSRFVVGGLFRGYTSVKDGYMGLMETALTVLPEGNEEEFLALFNPGFRKPTYSRAYFSRLNPGKLAYDCNRHGGDRACIACMHCADVCPVDILPEFAYKAILAEEVEEYLEHGLLDCVECGLCSYVCPSKIDLAGTLIKAKADYARDQVSPDAE